MVPIWFGADERMDPAITYEVARILWENSANFPTWHVQGGNMSQDLLPSYFKDPSDVHAGAQKFYTEKGIEVKELGAMLR